MFSAATAASMSAVIASWSGVADASRMSASLHIAREICGLAQFPDGRFRSVYHPRDRRRDEEARTRRPN